MIPRPTIIGVMVGAFALWPAAAGARQGHGAPAPVAHGAKSTPETVAPGPAAHGTSAPAAHTAKSASETAAAPAPAAAGVKPTAGGHAPATASVKPPVAGPAPKTSASTADLQSALARIDDQIKATLGPPPAQAVSKRAGPPPPAPARIRLRWRVGLTWPAELESR